jgi:hypothetical protein
MGGKWMAFVPSRLRGVVMRSVIDGLRERGLDYIVKTSGGGRVVRVPSIITSGRVSVVRYGVCMYYGEDYVFEVEVGVLPGAVYFFVIGVALFFLGLALIAVGW